MSRRKGERPIPKTVRPYDADHPVRRWIADGDGDGWFDAWVGQMCTPYAVLTKKTGIAQERLFELSFGEPPTLAEIDALAKVWLVPPEGLIASIADASACQPLFAASKA